MNEETKNMNTEQAQEQQNADPTETGGPAAKGKTFTQDEVNRIVSDRLARERAKTEAPEINREQEFNAREENLKCRELIVTEEKYPPALLKVLDTGDFEKFKSTADALIKYFPELSHYTRTFHNPLPPAGGSPVKVDPIAQAFKPKT